VSIDHSVLLEKEAMEAMEMVVATVAKVVLAESVWVALEELVAMDLERHKYLIDMLDCKTPAIV